MDRNPTRWPKSPRIAMRCAPRAANGSKHLGLCALQAWTAARPCAPSGCKQAGSANRPPLRSCRCVPLCPQPKRTALRNQRDAQFNAKSTANQHRITANQRQTAANKTPTKPHHHPHTLAASSHPSREWPAACRRSGRQAMLLRAEGASVAQRRLCGGCVTAVWVAVCRLCAGRSVRHQHGVAGGPAPPLRL